VVVLPTPFTPHQHDCWLSVSESVVLCEERFIRSASSLHSEFGQPIALLSLVQNYSLSRLDGIGEYSIVESPRDSSSVSLQRLRELTSDRRTDLVSSKTSHTGVSGV
jgi:hypothetical protein